MREGRPWVWQADAYGTASTAHTLLFGQYMEVERVRDSTTGTHAVWQAVGLPCCAAAAGCELAVLRCGRGL